MRIPRPRASALRERLPGRLPRPDLRLLVTAVVLALVADNTRQLGPTLDALDRVTGVLVANQASLDQVLALAGPYYRLVGNTLGNGRWFDSYLCGLVPKDYLPPGTPPDQGCMPPKATGGA
jgi:phospholipid/cholesterol/gamma-HCH transport system substrate-binding protein